ncbi:FeoA domain-containing protein [Thiohalocapsa marina]|uniref:FeoA domain-containing protein n=1 Tax=Thiohalocapsa marina TaxID=424902 RepID=UPI0036DB8AD0
MQQPVRHPLPLDRLPVGALGRVIEIRGGRGLIRTLLGLGLRLGSEIRVEQHRGRGLVVSAGSTRIALGGGIVEKLLVMPLDAGPDAPTAAAMTAVDLPSEELPAGESSEPGVSP